MSPDDTAKVVQLYGADEAPDPFTRDFGDIKSDNNQDSSTNAKTIDYFDRDFSAGNENNDNKNSSAVSDPEKVSGFNFDVAPNDFSFGNQAKAFANQGLNKLVNPIGSKMTPLGVATLMPTLAAGPILGGASKLAAGSEMLGSAAPYISNALKFMGGAVESNKERNLAGEVINPSTIGNKLTQLGSASASNAATGGLIAAENGGDIGHDAFTGAWAGPAGFSAIKAIEKLGGFEKIAAPYVNKLVQAFQRDGISPEQITNKLTEMGEHATLADIGGANVKGLAGAVAQSPGSGAQIASDALENRQLGQVDRLTKSALKGLDVDPAATYEGTIAKLDTARQAAASPLYKEAYDANKSMVSPELNRILTTPAGKTALRDSVRIMQNNRKLVGMSDPELVEQAKLVGDYEPGSGGIAPGLNMETLDNTKKALDVAYANSRTSLNPKGDTSILAVKNDLLDEMDKLDVTKPNLLPSDSKTIGALQGGNTEVLVNPKANDVARIGKESKSGVVRTVRDDKGNIYVADGDAATHHDMIKKLGIKNPVEEKRFGGDGESGRDGNLNDANKYIAKSAANNPAEAKGSYARGRSAYAGPSQSSDAVESGYNFMKNGGDVSKISDSDKPFYRIGAANYIRDTFENSPDGVNAVRKIFGSPAKREALQGLFPSKTAFDDFAKSAENEAQFFKTKADTLGNSKTASRQEALADLSSNNLTKTAKVAGKVIKHGAELAMRNPVGMAAYAGKNIFNSLTAPRSVSEEMSNALGNALFTPEGSRAAISSLTPAPKSLLPNAGFRGQNLLNGYMDMLGRSNGLQTIEPNLQTLSPRGSSVAGQRP